ncbi:unnamed protein product [Euphydryas editha]|uniref:Uncharacterized protein n=1 Tax=Euphydryas editha TaxID=104508 RepID=A0AAU9UCA0_EUPED|nr:unnamed protein product [Euphydryas editha]
MILSKSTELKTTDLDSGSYGYERRSKFNFKFSFEFNVKVPTKWLNASSSMKVKELEFFIQFSKQRASVAEQSLSVMSNPQEKPDRQSNTEWEWKHRPLALR